MLENAAIDIIIADSTANRRALINTATMAPQEASYHEKTITAEILYTWRNGETNLGEMAADAIQ